MFAIQKRSIAVVKFTMTKIVHTKKLRLGNKRLFELDAEGEDATTPPAASKSALREKIGAASNRQRLRCLQCSCSLEP
jgi:hypothetical protein